MRDTFFVHVLANTRSPRPVLYVGITDDLVLRVAQHRCEPTGFTGRYHVDKLVYFESFSDVNVAIAREKQIKGWRREKKIALVERFNPGWTELLPPGGPSTPSQQTSAPPRLL